MKKPILNSLGIITSSLCLLFALWASPARAGLLYWDNNGTSTASDGTWDLSATNWAPSSTLTSSTLAFTNGAGAIFTAGPAVSAMTVTVTNPITIDLLDDNGVSGNSVAALTINASGTGELDLAAGTTNQFYQSSGATVTINCPINGAGTLIQNGSGSLQLYGTNSYSGGTIGTGGQILYYNNSGSFGTGPIYWTAAGSTWNTAASTVNLTNDWYVSTSGVLNAAAGNTIWSGNFYLQATPQIKNNGGSTTVLEISGPISEIGGSYGIALLCPNSGKIVLSGTNTYSGKTSIATLAGAGTSTVSVSSLNSVNGGNPPLDTSSLGRPTTVPNGTIDLGYAIYAATLIYTGPGETSDRVINLSSTSAGVALEADGSDALVLSSDFTATGLGSKTLTLQGSSTAANEISGAIVDDPTTGSTVTAATFASAKTTITLASVDGITVGASISGTGIPAGDTVKSVNTSTKVVTLNTATTGAGTLGETITVPGVVNITSVTKAGTGTWVLGGANTYSGNTTVSGGTLVQGAANVIPYGAGKGNFASSGTGTLDLNGIDCQLNGFGTSSGTIDNQTGSGTYTLTLGNNNAGGTHSGVIANTSGTLALTKVGTGNITLSGANTYSGITTISQGTLVVKQDNNLGTPPTSLVANQLTLDNANNFGATGYGLRDTGGNFTLDPNRGVYLTANGGSINVQNGFTLTVAGPISGSGAFWASPNSSAGYGTIILSNPNNNYSGGTYVGAGTLKLGVNGGLPTGTALTIGAAVSATGGGFFDMNGMSQTIGPLASNPGFGGTPLGTPTVKLTGALTIIESSDSTFAGVINGSGGSLTLDSTSTSTLTLSGTNTYTGLTTIKGGTLDVNATGSIAGSVAVANGGKLELDNLTAMAMAATAGLYLDASPAAGEINLTYSGTQTINVLVFGSTPQATGTWGSLTSSADHKSAAFIGNGLLLINPPPNATGIALDPSGNISLTVTGAVGSVWSLRTNDNVTVPLPWPSMTNGTITASPYTVLVPPSPSVPQQFYYFTNTISP